MSDTDNNNGTVEIEAAEKVQSIGQVLQAARLVHGMKHFEIALEDPLYSTPEMANTNAGTCELSRGNYRSAEEYFQKALMLKPKYSPALIGLTKMHYSSGNLAAAKLNLARYMHTSIPTAEGLWLGVKIERKAGNRQSAANYASQLKKRFPDSKEAIALSKGEF